MKAVSFALLVLSAIVTLGVVAGESAGDWTQWGGPNQEFRAQSTGLASEWPENGPKKLWTRELGDGYSAILFEAGKLYTMYRDAGEEVAVSLSAADGKTLWEYRYKAAPSEIHVTQFGEGPRSTPLIAGNRIYTIGVSGIMHCLDKKTGKSVWSHDLWKEFGGTVLNHGYSSSPIEYKNTVIVLGGGDDQSLIAFDKQSGRVAWKGLSYKNSYSTPRIHRVGDEEQLIVFMASALIGVDPANGKLKWEYPIENQWGQNINMPVMADKHHLFLSTSDAGARGLKLTPNGDKTDVEEVWSTRKIQFYHITTVRNGDYVFGTTGNSPAFLSAVNIKTGEIAWRKRGFAKSTCVYADGRLLILGEDGKLSLTTATPEDLTVHSEMELFDGTAWTVPTVVGTTMFARDKTSILALDLS